MWLHTAQGYMIHALRYNFYYIHAVAMQSAFCSMYCGSLLFFCLLLLSSNTEMDNKCFRHNSVFYSSWCLVWTLCVTVCCHVCIVWFLIQCHVPIVVHLKCCSWNISFHDHCSTYPVFSNKQHLSYGGCLEVRGEIIRTVLCCIVYWSCAQS